MKKIDSLMLVRSKSTVFTFKEILFASSLQDKPALLKRRLNYYVSKGELYSIRRGLYAKDSGYDRREAANKLVVPSYVSFETILLESGAIFQLSSTLFMASHCTKEVVCDGQTIQYRKLKDTILLNTMGIENRGHYFAATKERAFLDMLYIRKEYFFDNIRVFDVDKVMALLPLYDNKRMAKVVSRYFKKLNEE